MTVTAAGGSAAPPTAAPTGRLELILAPRGERTVAVHQFHTGALRVLRPHHLDGSGQPCFVVVNPGGGYLGGDHYELDVAVEAAGTALVTTQSATKVYRTPVAPARQDVRFTLGPDAVLEYLPDQLIAYANADYVQHTMVKMDPTACFMAGEVVTPGWAPDGTSFRYRSVVLRTEVVMGGHTVVLDNLRLRPGEDAVAELGFLEGHSHLGSLLVVDPRADRGLIERVHTRLTTAESRMPGLRCGVSPLPVPGLIVRALGPGSDELTELLHDISALLRSEWTGQPRVDLRKY
ncbi:urease accessory protein UreD [Kocuria flava]|uniref:Urease accessory protein UreD n=1 Tax=Kocuria flava TaxID=446860 RepID=A0A0U3G0L9_9MICC|nr:urease accessory protein UreD [Kocuria flava]GEO93406.1 urease accessory protein UreD [Kocuria flava]